MIESIESWYQVATLLVVGSALVGISIFLSSQLDADEQLDERAKPKDKNGSIKRIAVGYLLLFGIWAIGAALFFLLPEYL